MIASLITGGVIAWWLKPCTRGPCVQTAEPAAIAPKTPLVTAPATTPAVSAKAPAITPPLATPAVVARPAPAPATDSAYEARVAAWRASGARTVAPFDAAGAQRDATALAARNAALEASARLAREQLAREQQAARLATTPVRVPLTYNFAPPPLTWTQSQTALASQLALAAMEHNAPDKSAPSSADPRATAPANYAASNARTGSQITLVFSSTDDPDQAGYVTGGTRIVAIHDGHGYVATQPVPSEHAVTTDGLAMDLNSDGYWEFY